MIRNDDVELAGQGRREVEARDRAGAVQVHERRPAAGLENNRVHTVDLQMAASEVGHGRSFAEVVPYRGAFSTLCVWVERCNAKNPPTYCRACSRCSKIGARRSRALRFARAAERIRFGNAKSHR